MTDNYSEFVKSLQFPINDRHRGDYISGKYDNEVDIYREILKTFKDPIFVDVGSNVGFFSTILADDCKEVHSFEPVSKIFECLQVNTERYPNVKVNPLALGNEVTTANIFVSSSHSQGSTLDERTKNKFAKIFQTEEEQISITTLNKYMLDNNIQRVSLLKIDVEGFEGQVIEGTGNLLKCVDNIVFESYFVEDVERIKEYTKYSGFEIERLSLQAGGPMYLLRRSKI